MKNLLNPKWLFLINTIPIAILFFIFYNEYSIIHTLLEKENIILWKRFGIALAILGFLNLGYILFSILKKKRVSPIYGITALIIYIPFLYIYGIYANQFIPFSVPRWMVSDTLLLSVGTFIMPTLAYALFVLVTHFTSERKEYKAWKNFLIALSVPTAWYVFTQLILPLWKPIRYNFDTHVMLILVIISTVLFLFFVIRTVYILAIKKSAIFKKYHLVWKIPIAIVFPLLGLAVNNGLLFKNFGISTSGIFGNFTSYWFYTLALLNGILICSPNLKNKVYRVFLFVGRSITYAYTFYFFLVFLPFLPFSIIAVIAFGIGFLMLTPLVLFSIHIVALSKDITFLKANFSPTSLRIIAFASFLMIPLFITITYRNDKAVLNEALQYIESPDYSKNNRIDTSSLSKTLAIIKNHKSNNWRGGIFGTQTPYLSSYFNWLVLDNLTLASAKINTINSIFFDETKSLYQSNTIRNKNVNISNISSKSKYDSVQKAWISWVDMEITNKSGNNWFSEYATSIELPVGCWISDYYLMVNGKKEMGILAEKKAAMWIFSQIRNENRDPGILYYQKGNRIAFRVFPFAQDETRKTGIEFIHKEPINLTIDNHTLTLGKELHQENVASVEDLSKNVVYVSAKEKALLDTVQRTPYYHFIVDISKGDESIKYEYLQRIEQFLNKSKLKVGRAKISFVNAYTTTMDMNENWKENLKKQTLEGGFYLDRAIKKALVTSYISKDASYPLFVVVTDNFENAILSNDYADLKITFPENDVFYSLSITGNLIPHSLLATPNNFNTDSIHLKCNDKVLAYPNAQNPIAFLPNDNQASILLKNDFFEIDDTQISKKNWQSALTMQGKWISQKLHPETPAKEWLSLVKSSFISKIMSPVTSYLVVENEAQKTMLKRKQKQVLSGNKLLDLGEEAQQMSEPSLWILALLMVLILGFRNKKRIQQNNI